MMTSSNGNLIRVIGPFVWRIHRSPVNSHHKGQWRGDLVFSLICAWTNGWVNNRDAGDLRRNRTHYDVTIMYTGSLHYWHPPVIVTHGITHGHWDNHTIFMMCLKQPSIIWMNEWHPSFNTLRPRKMAAVLQTTFSNAFSWMKIFEFRLKFHWNWFLRVQLTTYHHWVR